MFDETLFPFRASPSSTSSVSSPLTHTYLLLSLCLPYSCHFVPNASTKSPPFSALPESSPSPSPTASPSPNIPPPPRYPTRTRCPKVHTDGTIPWSPPRAHATTVDLIPLEPTVVSEALKYTNWRLTLPAEFRALLQTRT